MTTFTKKSLLLGSCAVALVLTAGVAQGAAGPFAPVTTDRSGDIFTAAAANQVLAISGAGSINKAVTDGKTGLKITIGSSTKDTLAVTAGDAIAINGTSTGTTWNSDGITVTTGTVQNSATATDKPTIALGNGNNGGKVTIGANGVVQNLGVADGSRALTFAGTGTFVVENAGLIRTGASGGTAIDGGTAQLNFTNTGAGSVVGIISLGSNAASTLIHTSTGKLEDIKLDSGQVLSLGDSATPGTTVGDVGAIDGVEDNRGKVNVYGTSKVASIGADHKLAEVTLAKGAVLTVTNGFTAQAFNIADAASHTFTGNAAITTTTLTGTGAIVFNTDTKVLTGNVVAAANGAGNIIVKDAAAGAGVGIAGDIGSEAMPFGKILVGEGNAAADNTVKFGTSGTVYANGIEVAKNSVFAARGGQINAPISGSGAVASADVDGSTFNGAIGSASAPMSSFSALANTTIASSAYVKATTIARDKTLTIDTGVTGLDLGEVDGVTADRGTIIFNSNYATTAAFGSTNKLAAVSTGTGSVVFTANHNINAGSITINHVDSIFNVNAPNLTIAPIAVTNGTLNINAAGLTLGAVTGNGTVNVLANFKDSATITANHMNVGSPTVTGVTFTTGGNTIATGVATFTNFAGNTVDVANSATINGTVANKGLVILESNQVLTTTKYSAAAGSTTTFTLSSDGKGSTTEEPALGARIITTDTSIDPNATLDFATQGVVPVDGAIYRLVQSTNTPAAPAFTATTLDYPLLSYAVGLSGNHINATVARKDVSALPTENADQALLAQVGGVLFSETATDNAKKYFAPLLSLKGDAASAALQKILSASQTQNFQVAQTAMSTVVNNIGNSVGSAAAPITASAGNAVAAGGTNGQGLEFWGKILGSTEDQESRAGYDGYKANTYGFTLGANTHLMDGVNMGLAFSMAKSEVKERVDSSSKTKTNNYFVSLYGSYSPLNTWFVDGVLTAGSGKYDQKRVDSFNSATIYDSKFGGTTFNGTFKVGQGYKLADGMMVRPYAATSLGSTTIDAHTETGGAGAISLPKARLNTAQLGVGAAASMVTKMADNWTMAPNMNISYMREFCTKARTLNATMVGVPVALSTPKFAADIISGGVGVKMENTEGVSVAVDYAATGKDNYIAHTGMIRVAKAF